MTSRGASYVDDWNLCLTGSSVGSTSSRGPVKLTSRPGSASGLRNLDATAVASGGDNGVSKGRPIVQPSDKNQARRQSLRSSRALSTSSGQLSARSNTSLSSARSSARNGDSSHSVKQLVRSNSIIEPAAPLTSVKESSSVTVANYVAPASGNVRTKTAFQSQSNNVVVYAASSRNLEAVHDTALTSHDQKSSVLYTLGHIKAAVKIQRWFRMVRSQSHAWQSSVNSSSVKDLFESKRQRLLQQWTNDVTKVPDDASERARQKEEKARLARLDAIEELKRKREEKRSQAKALAEEELTFLQTNGKVSKRVSNTKLKSASSQRSVPGRKSVNMNGGLTAASTNNSQKSDTACTTQTVPTESERDSSSLLQSKTDGGGGRLQSVDTTAKSSTAATTFDDLMSALKQLEEDDQLPIEVTQAQKQSKLAWLDDLESASDGASARSRDGSKLSQRSHRTDDSSSVNSSSGTATNNSVVHNYLDKLEADDRLGNLDQEIERINAMLTRPALLVPSSDEVLEQATMAASEVTQQMLMQKMELEEKKRSVAMLQKALNQQRELTIRHAKETEKELTKRLDVQKAEYEEAIKRHITFIDQLIDDKKNLSEKCEQLVKELKTVDKKYQDKIKTLEDSQKLEIQKLRDLQDATEKLRREKWIEEKTKKIKEMTVKGLEPEIQRLIAQHKAELKKIKSIHEAELLASDERASQRYVKLIEELRDQLATEKEAACARERQLAKDSYEEQLRQRELIYQQQQHRLYQEVKEEKERIADGGRRQRAELDALQRRLEETHSNMMASVRTEYEAAKQEQEHRHAAQVRQLQEQLEVEKQVWQENYRKKQDALLLQKERELQQQLKSERDREIESVMQQLLKDNQSAITECEREAERRIKKLRDKLEKEKEDAEQSERQISEKYSQIKGRLTEAEGDNECLKVALKQKEKDLDEYRKLLDKRNEERDRISDVIRQEFADRIVAVEEENKRLKNEMAELKARHRAEIERIKTETDVIVKAKADEMEEVHKRVKQAIAKKEETLSQMKEQYEKAVKRADHLEDLLEQQRKQLLGRK